MATATKINMKRLNKVLLLAAFATIAGVVLAGCSGSADEGEAVNPTGGKMIPEAVPATQGGGDGGNETTQTKGTPP